MQKNLGLDLRNFQPIQIAKDAKTRRFVVRKVCSRDKNQGFCWINFCQCLLINQKVKVFIYRELLEEIRHVTHRSPPPSKLKQGIEIGLPRKDLWKSLLPNRANP